MALTPTKQFSRLASLTILLIAAVLLAAHFSTGSKTSSRQQLLEMIPVNSTAVIFLDLDEFKPSPFLRKLYSWAPRPALDSEYAQFVKDTGFSYERDLRQGVVAIKGQGASTDLFAVADGAFDRKKIEGFLNRTASVTQQGKLKVFLLNESSRDKPLSLAFLSDERIVISDSQNLAGMLVSAQGGLGRAEWNSRFDRLAGSPLFALVRQDSAMQNVLNSAAPGNFRSPQLSALLDQLQWISIAGKPDGDQLRVVSEGECLSASVATQLREFLQGVLLLAENGLNDPKLRQQMNPEEREAYLELIRGADVQRIDRGEWKTVRVVLSITPKFLDTPRTPPLATPATTADPAGATGKGYASRKSKTSKKN